MSRYRLPALKMLAIASLAMWPAVASLAGPQQSRERGSSEEDRGNDRPRRDSLSDAVRRVERNTRGEVLSAERVQYDGRDMHRVKVVDDQGRVRVFMQDPRRNDPRDVVGSGNLEPRPDRRRPAPTRGDDD